MAQEPLPEDIARWDQWFAVESTNRAWTLAENPARTPADDEEMLRAAHAAAFHWGRIGTDLNKTRADMLVAQAHALAGNGSLALRYARRSHAYITSHESPDWEIAFSHLILANAARAAGERSLYLQEYALAKRLGEGISGSEDREIFQRSFVQLPIPADSSPAK